MSTLSYCKQLWLFSAILLIKTSFLAKKFTKKIIVCQEKIIRRIKKKRKQKTPFSSSQITEIRERCFQKNSFIFSLWPNLAKSSYGSPL
jgi:hypothetical protein